MQQEEVVLTCFIKMLVVEEEVREELELMLVLMELGGAGGIGVQLPTHLEIPISTSWNSWSWRSDFRFAGGGAGGVEPGGIYWIWWFWWMVVPW
jgi:hypothetical protein